MINISKLSLYTLIVFYAYPIITLSNTRDFQTTRLSSTAGTGVGSVLMDEATFLNPAPLAFYRIGSFYFQKTNLEASNSSDETKGMTLVASDSKGKIAGSISYQNYETNNNEIKIISGSLSSPMGQKSAFGVTYRMTENNQINQQYPNKYKQFLIGVCHAVTKDFTVGFLVIDPTEKIPEDSKALVGFQYVYKDFITLMADLGSTWDGNMSKNILYRGGMQFKILADFYLRFGAFQDKKKNRKGSGAGISWVSPKLTFNLAGNYIDTETNEELKETSFSVSYRF